MKEHESRGSSLPVVGQVDVLVVGGTVAGVAFALSSHARGLRVMLIAPHPYLGEDVCAGFRFWPEPFETAPELAWELFGTGDEPPTPLHIKKTLEQKMVQADIPFLLNCQPAGVLRNTARHVGGVVMVNRTGRQAIQARLVVDATLDARVLEQAGAQTSHRPSGKQSVSYLALYDDIAGKGQDWPGDPLPGYRGDDFRLSARRQKGEIDFGDGSAAARSRGIAAFVAEKWQPGEYRHASWIVPAHGDVNSARLPTLEELSWGPGILALTESIRLEAGREAVFQCPLRAIAIAETCSQQINIGMTDEPDTGKLKVSCAGSVGVEDGAIHSLSDALRPGLGVDSSIRFDANSVPRLGSFDVVVVGGGTGGAPAGISAARAGASTLVVEVTSGLGGVGTMGQIARYWCGNRVGFTAEIDQGVARLELNDLYQKGTGDWSVAAKCAWYHQTAHNEGATLWFNTLCAGVWVVDGRVRGVLVSGPYGYGLVEAGCVVDCTGCSDIPAAAGAPTLSIGKDHVAVQGTGLAGIKPGREYHNSDHNFSDDTDVMDATAFFVSAKLKFSDEFDCGELVDSRERRQIVGDLTLQPEDVLYQRRFPDTVCVATSNFDSHGFTVHPVFMLLPPDKETAHWADVPFRAFLPVGLDGVMVTGLGLSAHRDVLPVVRMQADVQNQGYAAGYMAAQSALGGGIPLREILIEDVQAHLIKIGNLPDRVLTDVDTFPVSDAVLQQAVEEGWNEHKGLSLLLSDPARSVPRVRAALQTCADSPERELRYAQLLALMDDDSGLPLLIQAVAARCWDTGWDYRGMHQFGMSMSEVDGLLVALGRIGDESAWPCILEKIRSLPDPAAFSHCRALAIVCEDLYQRHPNHQAAIALAEVLRRPGYRGHAQVSQREVQARINADLEDNSLRNVSLRELHLARALFRCGDVADLGRDCLRAYAQDLRGHFSQHARAVLAASGSYPSA